MSNTIIMYENGKAVGGEGHPTNADEITFNNEDTDLVSEDVESAIKEVNAKFSSDLSRLKGDILVPVTIATENAFCREIGRRVATIPDNSSVTKSVLWADHNIYSLIATRRSVYIIGLLSCPSSVLSFIYTSTSDTVSGIKITGTAI